MVPDCTHLAVETQRPQRQRTQGKHPATARRGSAWAGSNPGPHIFLTGTFLVILTLKSEFTVKQDKSQHSKIQVKIHSKIQLCNLVCAHAVRGERGEGYTYRRFFSSRWMYLIFGCMLFVVCKS